MSLRREDAFIVRDVKCLQYQEIIGPENWFPVHVRRSEVPLRDQNGIMPLRNDAVVRLPPLVMRNQTKRTF